MTSLNTLWGLIGLGNPGSSYLHTRHNIGQQFLFAYANKYGNSQWQEKFLGQFCTKEIQGIKTHCLFPTTYMNLSGKSVSKLCQFFKIPPPFLLVLHDELDLPFGTLSFKKGGGTAGHNGLKSLQLELQDTNFWRLRLGIGRPTHPSFDVSSFVLGKFFPEEEQDLLAFQEFSFKALDCFFTSGPEKALQQFNKKKF